MNDNFEFSLIGGDKAPFRGYASSIDKTVASPQLLVFGSRNVYKKNSGTIAPREGLLRRGTADATAAAVKSSYEWNTSLGATRVLRVANGKFQVESNVADGSTQVWYDLLTGLTLTRFIFDKWWDNTEKKDRLVFAAGDTSYRHWSGGICKIASGTAAGTLAKSDTTKTWAQEGFATNTVAEKKFKIGTQEYTYTGGENTSTLQGVSPDPSLIAANSIAVQSVIVEANTPASTFTLDIVKTIGNRVHCASNTSRLVYISSSTNFKDFTVPTPRLSGSAELLTLDDSIKGISVRQGNAWISAGLSDWYEVSYSQITVGAVLTEATKVDKKPTSNLGAALAHEFIDVSGDNIIYLAQDQQVRNLGSFANIFSTKYPTMSQDIRDELSAEDFTGGHLRVIGDNIWITAPVSGNTYLHQVREDVTLNGEISSERLWFPPQELNISRVALISGVEYGHSNQNPQIYQLLNTGQWYDDSPSDTELPYEAVMRLAYRDHGLKQGLLKFDKEYFEGYILSNSPLYCKTYYDYLGASGIVTKTLNAPGDEATIFADSGRFGLGSTPLGGAVLGDAVVPNDGDNHLPKFRVITNMEQKDIFEYELEVYSEDAGARWEMLYLGTNARKSPHLATFIRK